ncbi:ABC transporter permease [Streptomyces sp. 4N509B]|uniref:ABC transporter permease n=1 Tax=Streptomyces sp. 4N509B TaxID=3457413 RepID=UPI003FD53AF5
MTRRNVRRALRYPALSFGTVMMPVLLLLLFVYVFGGSISHGLQDGSGGSGGGGGREAYLEYLAPGILLMTVASGSIQTAVSVCSDMTEGIVARFRTMPISRSCLLAGHVVGSMIQTMVSVVLVAGVAWLLGFNASADAVEWLAALGLLTLLAFAMTWLSVGLGLASRTPEAASNNVLPVSFMLPFLSSAFVPLASLPGWLRPVAEHQPFTPVIETLRGLLTGGGIGGDGALAVAWCVGITVLGYAWGRWLFNRGPVT